MEEPINEYDRQEDFWDLYRKGRCPIPDSIFQRFYDYHSTYGTGKFDVLHEPGAGAAVHSARFAKKFDKLIVTDPSEQNVEQAKQRLEHLNNVEVRLAKIEDDSSFAEQSVDMVIALTCIHWADTVRAVEAVQRQLRSGGTFAICFVGVPFLLNKRAQEIWLELHWQAFTEFFELRNVLGNPAEAALWTAIISGYDSIAIPASEFDNVFRLKNYGPEYTEYERLIPPQHRSSMPNVSNVGAHEHIETFVDGDLKASLSIQDLKDTASSIPFPPVPDNYEPLWHQLEEAIGGEKVDAIWALSIILARKK